ncbi:MAG TPA: hypothetical protein VHE30_01970 [Polyangiaceae bacterium]|nr:hypothetical protein [Polyangiaceae bacterium]
MTVACGSDTVAIPGGGQYVPTPDGSDGSNGGSGGAGGGTSAPGLGVGDACDDTVADSTCRGGLACVAAVCAFAHTAPAGSACSAAGECAAGLQCTPTLDPQRHVWSGTCTAVSATAGDVGAGCSADSDCRVGLRCGIVGLAAQCIAEGSVDVGGGCATSGDCFAGLVCAPSAASLDSGAQSPGSCAPLSGPADVPPVSFGIPTAPKLDCEKPTQGTVSAYFEVPGTASADGGGGYDFFRLPFPNDARVTNGKLDLSGFPTPGTFLLGYDPVQRYVDAVSANMTGWSAYTTVLFRFNGELDRKSINFVEGQQSPVEFLDITDPANPGNSGAGWLYSPSGGKYICPNWLGVRRHEGDVLTPGHTYAVLLYNALRNVNGIPVAPAPQFTAMLASTPPTDASLGNAYARYQPLRSYLSAQGADPSQLVNAAVFTVADVLKPMKDLAAATNAQPVPTASGWVKCSAGAKSPCPQADGDRACGTGTADYDEYHALVTLPIFQQGTEPYDVGGAIDPSKPRTESVCVSLTVPKKAAPASGYPLTVFAHGTGGSFRDHARDEVAGALARSTPGVAVLGYDQVEHGPRRGVSTASPNNLFFNFKNPDAARGNPMQGAADVISMGRFARALVVPAAVSGRALAFDRSGAVFFGHSQGSMHGSLGLPYTNDYRAAVLSGNGAGLMEALLTKTKPQNIARAVPFVLGGDYDQNGLYGGDLHPVLSLLQQWIDPADPLNFAKSIAREPNAGIDPKSVFQTYGLADTYSPPLTMRLYATPAQLQVVTHDSSVVTPDAIANFQELAPPLAANFAQGTKTVTLALREYQNDTGDGHFVVFDVPAANQDAIRFLSMAAAGTVPQVGN